MTRFARAKGSKSSNERVPEQATSWSQMRRDLHRESVRKAAEEQIERESHTEHQQNFPDTSVTKINVREPVELVPFDDAPCYSKGSIETKADHTVSVMKKVPGKKNSLDVSRKKRLYSDPQENSDDRKTEESHCQTHLYDSARLGSIISESTSEEANSEGHKNNHKKINTNNKKIEDGVKPNCLPNNKRKLNYRQKPSWNEQQGDNEPKIGGNFKGYPVPVEDAETLTDAYNILRKEGLTHKQAMERIKPERRRAEKRLARLKSMICFRCRKPGHRLSDCPMGGLDSDVCFKCGSTTHKYQDCKKKGSFVNAKCFICGVVGHLSAQCPENSHGVYPEGGECRICGEKSHLVKDCPQNRNKKEQHSGATEFDDNFDEKPSETVQPKRKKLKKVQF